MGSDIVGLAFYDIVWDAHQQYVKLPILKNIYIKTEVKNNMQETWLSNNCFLHYLIAKVNLVSEW